MHIYLEQFWVYFLAQGHFKCVEEEASIEPSTPTINCRSTLTPELHCSYVHRFVCVFWLTLNHLLTFLACLATFTTYLQVFLFLCVCVGTVWQGCQGTTRRRTSAAQRPTTVCWKIWSSGHNTRSRWLPTLEPVWASTAALSRSTLCREVSKDTQTLYFLVLVGKADVPRKFVKLCRSSLHAYTHITEFKVFPHEHISSIIFQCTLL